MDSPEPSSLANSPPNSPASGADAATSSDRSTETRGTSDPRVTQTTPADTNPVDGPVAGAVAEASSSSVLFTPTGEFRAVWRLLFFAAIAYASAYVLVVGSRLALLATGVRPEQFVVRWLFTLILPVALLVAHAASLFAFDRRGWSYVWLGRASFNAMAIARGTVWGALAIGIPTLLLLGARQFAIYPAIGGTWLGATVRTTAMLLPLALWEELVFRGYPFAVLRQAIGWKGALIATSVVFGVAHMQNSGVDPQNIIIVTMAGLFLGLILLATRSLYAAWAAHFAWNWMMACAFHVNVSGNPFERPVYEMVAKGPVWVTGGVWGPEGGIGAAIGLFLGVVYVYGRYLKPLET